MNHPTSFSPHARQKRSNKGVTALHAAYCHSAEVPARALGFIPGLIFAALALSAVPSRAADSGAAQVAAWTALAKASDGGFAPSAERGKVFYSNPSNHNADMTRCSACHTANPAAVGKHVVTGKRIAALSVVANPERFTDSAKTEKWFKRNCNDVLGRACTPAEKADFVTYLLTAK